MSDQAKALRDIINKVNNDNIATPIGEMKTNAKVLTITSGKGGVGKTNITVNLAVALSDMGYRVVVIDADLPFLEQLEYNKENEDIVLSYKQREFQQTEIYKQSDIIEAYDKHGYEIEIEWLEVHSYHIVLEYHIKNGALTIIVDAN